MLIAAVWGALALPSRGHAFPGTNADIPDVLSSDLPEDQASERAALEHALASVPQNGRSRGLLQARLGRVDFLAGDYEAALAHFSEAEPTRVPDWVAFRRAESLFHLGRHVEAEAAWRAFLQRFPASDWRHRAAFRLGDAQLGQGRNAEALLTWRAALVRYPEFPARAALRFAMARAEAARGQLDRAAALYREIGKLDPGDPLSRVAARALAELEARGVAPLHPSPEERLVQALDLRRRKYYPEAIVALRAMLEERDVVGKVRDDAEWNIARSLWESEQFADSLVAFRKIHDATSDLRRKRKALRWIGYSLERLGDPDAAAKALAEASGRPSAPPAEVAEDIAWLYFNSGVYPKAESWFKRLPASTPGMRWMQAWLVFRRGEFKKAGELFAGLARKGKSFGERFIYWQARATAAAGNQRRAVELYQQVQRTSTMGYYGYQAGARLAEAGAAVAESAATGGALQPATRPSADPMPAALPVAEPVVPLLQKMVERAGELFPAAAEALDLTLLGERRLASLRLRLISDELRAFRKDRPGGRALKKWSFRPRPYLDNREHGKTGEWGRSLEEPLPPADPRRGPALAGGVSGEFTALLARAFVAIDDPHYARRHGSGRRLGTPPEAPENRSAWAERFPRAFSEILGPKARKYGLDPWLLWAFMTVESSYNPFAISRANARGLMQVMPQTGGLIADRMALRGFGAALLFEPEVTLEMAAWYVHALLEKFNGQSPLAIAAYNAGPHRVAAWLSRKGGLPMDEFVEEIPYDEAREYTKKVIRFWGLYRRIYSDGANLSLDLRVDPKFKNNINF